MAGILPESEQSEEVASQVLGNPYVRQVGTSKEFYTLTSLATKRIETSTLPPNLSTAMRLIMKRLHDTGPNESDELADILNFSITTTEDLLRRLEAYGYVERSTSVTASV